MKRPPPNGPTYEDSLVGVDRTVLLDTPKTRIVLYKLRPKHEVTMHSHVESEFGVMLSGTATHTMILSTERGGRRRMKIEEVRLRRGDCIVVPSGVPHAYVSGPGQESMILGVIMAAGNGSLPPEQRERGPLTMPVRALPNPRSRRIRGSSRLQS